MAANVQIRAATKTTEAALKRLRMEFENFEPILDETGERLVAATKGRFFRQATPTGKPWKRSRAAKKENRRTLVRSGRLQESIEHFATRDDLTVGTDVPYARIQQLGGFIKPGQQQKARAQRQRELAVSVRLSTTGLPRIRLKSQSLARGRLNEQTRQRAIRIPARRFLGISTKDRRTVREIVKRRAEADWR